MKNLIYFTISHNLDYVNLFKLCIESLYRHNYNDDILIITSEDFKFTILNQISFRKNPIFFQVPACQMSESSFNKLSICEYQDIDKYDKIIYCDCDIIWTDNPQKIFDLVDENYIYAFEENQLMTHKYWGGDIFSHDEKTSIINNKSNGLNAGFFAFKADIINIIKDMYNYCKANRQLMNECLEQPLFNVFIYRNKIYKTLDKQYIGFNEYKDNCTLVHFLGGPGNYSSKITKMSSFK